MPWFQYRPIVFDKVGVGLYMSRRELFWALNVDLSSARTRMRVTTMSLSELWFRWLLELLMCLPSTHCCCCCHTWSWLSSLPCSWDWSQCLQRRKKYDSILWRTERKDDIRTCLFLRLYRTLNKITLYIFSLSLLHADSVKHGSIKTWVWIFGEVNWLQSNSPHILAFYFSKPTLSKKTSRYSYTSHFAHWTRHITLCVLYWLVPI